MKPGEHKTVQSRILSYAEAVGWTMVSPRSSRNWYWQNRPCLFEILKRTADQPTLLGKS
jgi:hypothetical protein